MHITIEFTADDFGLDEGTNRAIEHVHRDGALTAASLMMGQPGTPHALEVIRRNPALQIGWHFHACDSQPLTCRRWPWGNSAALAGMALAVWPPARALIRRELLAQWHQFTATEVTCRFINGHHHLHIHPFIAREMCAMVAATFTGWVRGFEVKFFAGEHSGSPGYRMIRRWSARWLRDWPAERRTNSLWGLDRTFCMNADEVMHVLPTLRDGHHEFMFHPRRDNDEDQRALLELTRPHPLVE